MIRSLLSIIRSTQNSQYLTSKINSLVSLKLDFIRTSEDIKEKLLTENDEESSLVDKRFELSNLDLIKDMDSIIKLEEVLP